MPTSTGTAVLLAAASIGACGAPACKDELPAFEGGEPMQVAATPAPLMWAAQYRGEPTHRGVAAPGTSIGRAPIRVWKSDALAKGAYSASKSSPAVDEMSVYVGVDDGKLYALSREDGSVRWSFVARRHRWESHYRLWDKKGIHGTPAVDEGRVYVGDYDGWLYAVDKRTGALVWEAKLGDAIGASPVLAGGQIFISVEYRGPEGRVWVLRADTGARVWASPGLGDNPHGSVSIDAERGLLFVGANSEELFCFDVKARRGRWRYDTGGEIKSTPAVGPDLVYITSWDHRLHAVDIETGDCVFEVETGGPVQSSPSLYDGRVFFGSGDGTVYAVDARTGRHLWTFEAGAAIDASPTVLPADGALVIGARNRTVFLLALAGGAELWRTTLDGDFTSVPVAVGSSLLLNDDKGTVWRFDRRP